MEMDQKLYNMILDKMRDENTKYYRMYKREKTRADKLEKNTLKDKQFIIL